MLVGLAGCKGVGKDLAGSFLVEQGYTRLAFADKLKEAVANLFGIPIEWVDLLKGSNDEREIIGRVTCDTGWTCDEMDWRKFLQRFGTEMGRNTFGQNFWTDQLFPPGTLELVDDTVVTDLRFGNEAIRIKSLNGYIIQIIRPGYNPDGHTSEERLSEYLIDATVENNSTVEVFKAKVLATVHGLEVGVVSG